MTGYLKILFQYIDVFILAVNVFPYAQSKTIF